MLAWWLGDDGGTRVAAALAAGERLVTSELAQIECDRVLWRVSKQEGWPPQRLQQQQRKAEDFWQETDVLVFDRAVVARARQPFPGPALRSLDALHLSFLLVGREALGGMEMLSLDERLRTAARHLGLGVQPLGG